MIPPSIELNDYDAGVFSGLPKGSRVALVLENSYRLASLLKACFEKDMVAVPIDPHLPEDRINFIVDHSEANIIFNTEGYKITVSERIHEFSGLFLLIYTSGSTGDPKWVLLTKRAVVENARAVWLLHGFDVGKNHATCLPLYHCNALCMTLIWSLVFNTPFLLLEKFSPKDYIEFIEKFNVSTAAIVPALLEKLVAEKIKIPDCLEYFITAAAPLSSHLAERFYRLYGARLVQWYWLSEAVNFSFVTPKLSDTEFVEQYISQHPPVGKLLNNLELKLVEGEVLIKGSSLMKEYLKNEIASKSTFDNDGFLKTGDLGYLRGDYLVLSGRKKEIINRWGVVFYPNDIEEAWIQSNLPKSSVAVSVKNNLLSDEFWMFVEISEHKDISDLQRSIAEMSYYKPAAVQTWYTLRTAVGKPQRRNMGASLASRNISGYLYAQLSRKCYRIAQAIISWDESNLTERGWYIFNAAREYAAKYNDTWVSIEEGSGPVFESLDLFVQNKYEILYGIKGGGEIISQKKWLWKSIMSQFPMNEYAILCADFLETRNLLQGKILELGAWVGNTSNLLAGKIKGDFIRSDRGRDLNPDCTIGSFITYDFDLRPPSSCFDTIFATNALHCALDKKVTLAYLFDILNSGWSIVLSEGMPVTSEGIPWCLNMFYWMFDGWWDRSGFIERRQWIDMLIECGFVEIGWSVLRADQHDLWGLIWAKKP